MSVPSMKALRHSGYFSVSQAGGVAVGVPKITCMPSSLHRARKSSKKS